MLDDILAGPNMDKVQDISIGSFRVSKEFIKAMQKVRLSPLTAYPYEIKNGICTFDKNKLEKMTGFIKSKLLEKYPAEKIFVWE
jgi:spore photoproduct lyase